MGNGINGNGSRGNDVSEGWDDVKGAGGGTGNIGDHNGGGGKGNGAALRGELRRSPGGGNAPERPV